MALQVVGPVSCLRDHIRGFGIWCGCGWHHRWCGGGKRGGCVGRCNGTSSVRDVIVVGSRRTIHQGLSLAGKDPVRGHQVSV
jgi:hypothetical protein